MTNHKVTIWHDPEGVDSRHALALIADFEVDVDVIEGAVSVDAITAVLPLLRELAQPLPARALLDTRAPNYRAELADFDDAQLAQALAADLTLIKRPVVIFDGEAVIARPGVKALLLFRPKRPLPDLPPGTVPKALDL